MSPLLGCLVSLRHLAPELSTLCPSCISDEDGSAPSPHDVSRTYTVSVEQVLRVYQLAVHHCSSEHHNVVTASLELLRSLLEHAPQSLVTSIVTLGGIPKSYMDPVDLAGVSQARMSSRTPSCGSISGILGDEDSSVDSPGVNILMKVDSLDDGVASLQDILQDSEDTQQPAGTSQEGIDKLNENVESSQEPIECIENDEKSCTEVREFKLDKDSDGFLTPNILGEDLYSSIEIGKVAGNNKIIYFEWFYLFLDLLLL